MIRNYTTTFIKITLIIGVVVALFVAMRSTQTVGSTFATGSGTGGIELQIDNQTFYNGVLQPQLSWNLKDFKPKQDNFFSFGDIKPGDTGTTTISVHIKKNDAFVCLDFVNLKDVENGHNEPEGLVDGDNQGELSEELEFFAWHDDGDNIFEAGEKPLFGTSSQSADKVLKGQSYALADSTHGPAIKKNETHYIGINWCAGDLSVNVATAKISCDANAMGNEAQTDSMTLDVLLRAVPSKQQSWFSCVKENKRDHEDKEKDDDSQGHSGGGEYGHKDDNHNDDDDHDQWHYVEKSKSTWQSVKKYCVTAWNNVRSNKKS